MNLLDVILGSKEKQFLREVALRTAQRSQQIVWQRVAGRITTMSQDEARGYVRARARSVVGEFVDQISKRENGIRPDNQARLCELTLDAIARMIEANLRSARLNQQAHRRAA